MDQLVYQNIDIRDHENNNQDNKINSQLEPIKNKEQCLSKFKMKKIRVVIGMSGVGKSHFIKKITKNENIVTSDQKNSCTKNCNKYEVDGIFYIDTIGINDTDTDRYQTQLDIVKFLVKEKLKVQDLFFIYISSKELQVATKNLNIFLYIFFLYELFQESINDTNIQLFVNEFQNSFYFQKWQECNYNHMKDNYSHFRREIFNNKDTALNYLQYGNSFHIFVNTFFDKKNPQELKRVNKHLLEYSKMQIWSNLENIEKLGAYKEYISNQLTHLNTKIDNIIQNEYLYCQNENQICQIQYILLIGESQSGKSSLIEQLTGQKGIRGNGDQSKTNYCQIYQVEYENVRYNFIDTPGVEGTEGQLDPFDNLKIVADFLRRNKILEFKILFMVNADLDIRDNQRKTLINLIVFIRQLFDQDISFLDSDYLKFSLDTSIKQYKNEQNEEIEYLKKKIVRAYRIIEKVHNEIYIDSVGIKSVEFNSNYLITFYEEINIEEEEDTKQKKNLFEAINQIDSFSVDDKISFMMKKINNYRVIKNKDEFLSYKKIVQQKYKNLYEINQKIRNKQKDSNLEHGLSLIDQKVNLLNELDQLCFITFEDYFNQQILLEQRNSSQLSDEYEKNQINQQQNDMIRHFLFLQWPCSFLEDEKKNVHVNSNGTEKEGEEKLRRKQQNKILSRKQFYFSNLMHHLKPFIDPNNEKNLKEIEEIANIKQIQEIIFIQHIQNKTVDNCYNEPTSNLNELLEEQLKVLNLFLGTGGPIFRFGAYFSQNTELLINSYKAYKNVNYSLLGVNLVLAAICVGIDIYHYQKQYISKKQFALNTAVNITSIAIVSLALIFPGIGVIIGGFAALFGLFGNFISQICFTDKQTFDETIGLFIKAILNEQHSKLQLQYFQQVEFTKSLNTNQNIEKNYDLFRILQEDNFEDNKENLQMVFNSPQLKDEITKYLVKQIILKGIVSEFQEFDKDSLKKQDMEFFESTLKNNSTIVIRFFKKVKDEKQIQSLKEAQQLLEKSLSKLKISLQLKNENLDKIDNFEAIFNEFNNELKNYEDSMKEFIGYVNKQEISYTDQVKNCERTFSFCQNDYQNFFNSYCNIAIKKLEYLYQQKTIQSVSQSQNFKLLEMNEAEDQFLQLKLNQNQILEKLQLLDNTQYFISNRYIQKLKDQQQPDLTFISQDYHLETQLLDFSFDLYDRAKDCSTFIEFITKVKEDDIIGKHIDEDKSQRLYNFFKSINYLKQKFEVEQLEKKTFQVEQLEMQLI